MVCFFNSEVRLTPKQVNNEVRLLQSFSGNDETCALEYIRYISDYEFDNGCRAPPWRQVHGDICYLKIKPLDADELPVTANTAGVYRNKVSGSPIYSGLPGTLADMHMIMIMY